MRYNFVIYFIGNFNGIWLFVVSVFSEPVYVTGSTGISYIAKITYDNSVTMPIKPLPL